MQWTANICEQQHEGFLAKLSQYDDIHKIEHSYPYAKTNTPDLSDGSVNSESNYASANAGSDNHRDDD
jgi:hypothetical protein